ncbi:hypothetical protein SPFM15_00155 [Salmonella phage SPFM15]|nr:hypothetical protein SPFM5_00150 [Salmonella phage SPFM5]VFR13779.1 hypothetical protein SPFM15_00155 [Salmonella phage SPFM15]
MLEEFSKREDIGHYHLTSPARRAYDAAVQGCVNASRLCTHISRCHDIIERTAIRRVQADNLQLRHDLAKLVLALINKRQKQLYEENRELAGTKTITLSI